MCFLHFRIKLYFHISQHLPQSKFPFHTGNPCPFDVLTKFTCIGISVYKWNNNNSKLRHLYTDKSYIGIVQFFWNYDTGTKRYFFHRYHTGRAISARCAVSKRGCPSIRFSSLCSFQRGVSFGSWWVTKSPTALRKPHPVSLCAARSGVCR